MTHGQVPVRGPVVGEGHVNYIVQGPVGSVGKLQGVQERVCDGFEVCQHQALKILHYHSGQGDGSAVIMLGVAFWAQG